jgi:hypothetical protein
LSISLIRFYLQETDCEGDVSNWKGTSVLSAVSCFVSCYKREREAEDRRKAGD